MNELQNLDAMLDNLTEALDGANITAESIDEEAALNLWTGAKECHLIDTIQDEYGFHLVFADNDGNPMPSYFKSEPFGSVWAGKDISGLQNTLRSFKYALHMPSDTPLSMVKKNLETGRNRIYFYAEGRMGKRGMYYRNEINFKETQKL